MILYHSNNFRIGLKIIINEDPYEIESNEFIKPGKGQSFVRVKLKHLITGNHIEKIFKSTDSVQEADVLEVNMIYLYNDGCFWYFMNNQTFEQLAIDNKIIGNNSKWLFDQIECVITLWNNNPIVVKVPNFVRLEIIDAGSNTKGDTIGNNVKLAVLSTGAIIKVPSFIKNGEFIKIDTRSGEYISRIK